MTGFGLIALGALLSFAAVWLWVRITGFRAQKMTDYAGTEPVLNLRAHLNGKIKCEGVIYGPLGRVSSRFTADFEASWDGNRGVMKEHFLYDSGNAQDREWRLELANDGTIRADADDLVGQGTGEQVGCAMRLNYRIRLAEEAGGHVLDTVDWMYVTPGGTIVNRSQFRKFGIKVAELVATMQRVDV